ncbi:MAG: hypothetical protein AMJ75_03200 [Phycisphaerae bacterium SM1_79]|nr:MAG: hypothetical protein AMJ75_03200 [Phycisphaerae bacterium SM1_79]
MSDNCEKIRDQIADATTGLLSQLQVDALQQHLSQCTTCREFARALTEEDKLLTELFAKIDANMSSRHERVLRAIESSCAPNESEIISMWRTVMKSPITKLAAAAVIIIAVLVAIHQFGSTVESVAFGEIVRPFLTARTATFKVTIKGEGVPAQEYDGMFMEPCRMRHGRPGDETVVIVDLEQGKLMTLIPKLKQAVVIEMTNAPDESGNLNFFQEIRMRIQNAQPFDDESVESLGEKKIEGQSAIGYHVQKAELDAIVWASSKTKMPVRIEIFEDAMTIMMSNIVFDVELDESLFSLDVPEGYTVKTLRQDFSEPMEEDLIESFRIWAEHMDGKFPSKLHRSAVNEFMKYQQEKMKEKGTEPSIEDMTQMQQTIIDMTHGFPFVEALPAQSDWYYVGKDATFGDTDTPIFWYRPEGSETYRVIYADLTVADVEPDSLPQVSQSQPRSKDPSQQSPFLEEAAKMGADIPADKQHIVARMLGLNEKDVIRGLQVWLELLDGRYPNSLHPKVAVKQADSLLTAKYGSRKQADKEKKIQFEEKAYDIFFASAFYDKLIREKKDVAYCGDKITVEDSGKVLMRWKISDDKYRVVFGNLTRRSVTAEKLAELEKQPLE